MIKPSDRRLPACQCHLSSFWFCAEPDAIHTQAGSLRSDKGGK